MTKSAYEEIEFAVDSGATETVICEDTLDGVPMAEGKKTRYEMANGDIACNLGQKTFVADTGYMVRQMTAHAAEGLATNLMSVTAAT